MENEPWYEAGSANSACAVYVTGPGTGNVHLILPPPTDRGANLVSQHSLRETKLGKAPKTDEASQWPRIFTASCSSAPSLRP
jgi:hypothetical protein